MIENILYRNDKGILNRGCIIDDLGYAFLVITISDNDQYLIEVHKENIFPATPENLFIMDLEK